MKVMKFVLICLVIGCMILISACDENTTEPEPNIPYSPTPADNALSQAVSLTLSWNYDESTVTFDLYLGTTEEEINLLESDILTKSYHLDNLQFNTQYFWKITAKSENEEENESPIWNFTTDEKYTFELFGDYTNDNGNKPQFIIDEDSTDPFISFDGFPECFVLSSTSIQISLNNLSISGDDVNYTVESVSVEEFVNDNWQSFVEFSNSYQQQTEIVVVLVLDASNSLGYQFNNVKEYAKEFVNIVFNNSSEAMIGVVAFSTDITVFPISNNQLGILNNIDSIEQDEYTKMYDAMMDGINLLNQIGDADGYALVTFTDGIDNYSSTNYAEVIFTLENSNIKSFTMGLEGNGGIDEAILEALAVNSNGFEIVSSVSDLQNTFQLFAESVSNVYRINYIRNNQIIDEPREIKFILSSRPGVSNPVDFYEDFEDDSFQNWIPFGSPLPFVESNAGNPSPCFDNNGNSSYNSGALSQQTFDYSNGLVIEADMYVTSNPDGCWIEATLGLAKTMNYGNTTWPGASVGISYSYSGEFCWADPNKEGCMSMSIVKPDGETETFYEEFYNDYLDSWHTYKIVIDSNQYVTFFIDGNLIFEPTSPMTSDYTNMPLLLGAKSSSYGEAYHDNVQVSLGN